MSESDWTEYPYMGNRKWNRVKRCLVCWIIGHKWNKKMVVVNHRLLRCCDRCSKTDLFKPEEK